MKKQQLATFTAFIILVSAFSVRAESYVCRYDCWQPEIVGKTCVFHAIRKKDTFVVEIEKKDSNLRHYTNPYRVDEGKEFIVLSKTEVSGVGGNANAYVAIINKRTLSFINSVTTILGEISSKYMLDGKIDEGSSSSKKGRCRIED